MKNETVSLLLTASFTWLLAALVGALAFDTFVLYPNIFSDVPASLERSMKFLHAGSPRTFFAPAGSLLLLVGIATLIIMRKHKVYFRFCLTAFVLIMGGEFLLSALIFWPLNTIMFTEGLAMHSEAELIRVAEQFQSLQWLRLFISVLASVIAMVGFLLHLREQKN